MIRQWVCIDVRRRQLEGDYLLIDQILDLVLKIDIVFRDMSNTVGMISTSLILFVKLRVDIHGLGPHRVDVSDRG